MSIRLIQQQVPIGSEVVFFLKTGREITGVLDTIGRNHITLNNEKGLPRTIFVDMIGGWDVLNNDEKEFETREKDDPRPVYIEESEEDDSELVSTDEQSVFGDKEKSKISKQDDSRPVYIEESEKDDSELVSTDEHSVFGDEGQSDDSELVSTDEHSVSTHIQIEVIRKIIEIEAHYNAQLQTAKIELKAPNFDIPPDEIQKWKSSESSTIWHRIKNQYE